MSDLISRKSLLRRFNDLKMESASVGNEREYSLLETIIHGVENEPSAFDLESAIEQLQEKLRGCEYYHDKYGNMGNQIYAYSTALEIIKSATNATNGKKGE